MNTLTTSSLVTVQVCTLCGEEYIRPVSYCDETLECAMDDGEHLEMVQH